MLKEDLRKIMKPEVKGKGEVRTKDGQLKQDKFINSNEKVESHGNNS